MYNVYTGPAWHKFIDLWNKIQYKISNGLFPQKFKDGKASACSSILSEFGNILKKKKKAWQWKDLLIVFQTT